MNICKEIKAKVSLNSKVFAEVILDYLNQDYNSTVNMTVVNLEIDRPTNQVVIDLKYTLKD